MALIQDRRIRVLFADDDEDLLRLVKMKLNTQGFLVTLSLNGENVKDMAVTDRPDVILLDVTMHGNDGSDICRSLKSDPVTHDIPVILLSANDELKKIAEYCHADGYVPKPFDTASVKNKIDQLLMTKVF